MGTVNLDNYAGFREDSLKLSINLQKMVGELDAVLVSGKGEDEKALLAGSIVETYLPTE